MNGTSYRRWCLVGILGALFVCASATASEAQCYIEISVYADGAVSGYYENGNAELWAWGDFQDNSACQGVGHTYDGQIAIYRTSDGQQVALDFGMSTSVEVAAETHDVEMIVGVFCQYFQNYVGGGQSRRSIFIPPAPSCAPTLAVGPVSHVYRISDPENWPGLGSPVYDAAAQWNSRVNAQAFQYGASQYTHTFVMAPQYIGTVNWAITAVGGGTTGFNPETFWTGVPSFWNAILLHEMGHARGYLDVMAVNCINQTIMSTPWPGPNDPYPTSFRAADPTS